ncbi:MAG TPA: M56 family metallopeptidase [Terracidiphilus sp.]|nr:M56 family metallopeptidase [Terracidiphilus sp.]
MTGFGSILTGWSGSAASALVAAVWEGALLATAVWVVLRLLPRLSAAARSVVWLNVFVLMALLHLVPLLTGAPAAGQATASHPLRLDPRWSLLIAGLWLALSLLRAAQLATGAAHLRRLGRGAQPMDVSADLAELLEHHGHSVELCVSQEVARPSVLGFFRPRILVPPGLIERLTPAELKQVILHEMEHLRRGDDWTNLIQKLALVLFPLNPALAWVERRLCTERELACDDRVLHEGSGRKAYALCLAHLAEYSLVRRGFGLVLGAWEHRPELVRRVQRILRGPVRSMGRTPALAATVSLVAGALGCALALAHTPEMVSFAPPQLTSAQMAASLDLGQVSRALGGTPRMVKAELPPAQMREVPAAASHSVRSHAMRSAVVRQRIHSALPASRLAELRTPPPPQAGTLLVMTEWTDVDTPSQFVVAFAQTPDVKPGAMQAPATVHSTYAVVRTPVGWLVIQI